MFIFLYGSDTFRSTEKLNVLKKNFIKKNTSNASSSVFDFSKDASSDKLKSILKAEGLFSSNKLVIVKKLISSADKITQDEVLNFMKEGRFSNDVTLIIWEDGEPRKNNKLFKFFIDNYKSENFEKLSGVKLFNWIRDKFKKRAIDVDNQVINKLMSFVGSDLFQMNNEIDKLSNFSRDGKIKESDIDLIVKSKIEANIFETIEAIGSNNKNRALKMLHNQIEQGDDPFYILSMYIYQFRNLIKIADFYFDGINDKNIIAKETKLHPFVVQKGIQQLGGFSIIKLKSIYKELENIDTKVKTGKIGIEDALNGFIFSI